MPGTYLTDLFIRNVGPIARLDLKPSLNASGTPKPLVLVGKNGSGKTIALATIADALTELAKQQFRDIVPGQRVDHQPFFRLTGNANVRTTASGSLSLVRFTDAIDHLEYLERVGTVDAMDDIERFDIARGIGASPNPTSVENRAAGSHEKIRTFFESVVVGFFPSSRHEIPHWLNQEIMPDRTLFQSEIRVENHLQKPLVVERAAEQTIPWLAAVMADSLIDVDVKVINNPINSSVYLQVGSVKSVLRDKLILRQGRRQVETILQSVMEDPEARLVLNYRNAGARISVQLGGGAVLPSLACLSAGQALLLNLFSTIVRYAERTDLKKCSSLGDIKGIILIDEIDAHLHVDLQHDVLPRLMRLFPMIQFIVSSLSPLFVLGMERTYGREGVEIVEMPTGSKIGSENFGEFVGAFDRYRSTAAFEAVVESQVKAAASLLVLTEGKTDVTYIKTAIEVLGHRDLLDGLDIAEVGSSASGGTKGGGQSHLDLAQRFLRSHQARFPRKVLLLYDCDARASESDCGTIRARKIPMNAGNTKVKKGIENLLPMALFEPRFYRIEEKPTDDGGVNRISTFQKIQFCEWVCSEKRCREDFEAFDRLLIPLLREFAGNHTTIIDQPSSNATQHDATEVTTEVAMADDIVVSTSIVSVQTKDVCERIPEA